MIHPYAASLDSSEPFQSEQPDPLAGCFDVLQWLDSLVYDHLHSVLVQPDSLPRQQYIFTMWQPRWVCLWAISCSASVTVTTPTGRLPPFMSQHRDRAVATFPVQPYLNTASTFAGSSAVSSPSALSATCVGLHRAAFQL